MADGTADTIVGVATEAGSGTSTVIVDGGSDWAAPRPRLPVGEDCDATVASVKNTHRIQVPYEEKKATAAGTVAQMMGCLVV